MKFLQYLNEEYVATGKGLVGTGMRDKYSSFPIYKNPGSTDYKEIRKDDRASGGDGQILLRTIIDLKNKNIYVWNALHGVHVEGFNALKKEGELKVEPDSTWNLFCGAPDLNKNNKLSNEGAISFINYVKFYGLGDSTDYKGSAADIEKKCGWLKSYYKDKIRIDMRAYSGPTIAT